MPSAQPPLLRIAVIGGRPSGLGTEAIADLVVGGDGI
jgi:hypothetical protein